jgi:adenine-specific DNA-methyltransferase
VQVQVAEKVRGTTAADRDLGRDTAPPRRGDAAEHPHRRDLRPDAPGGGGEASAVPRNPDLDPQLVWRGKDAQDAAPLAVDTVPIYIQEKVKPEALIRDLRRQAGGCEAQANLFGDFDRIEDAEMRLDFYQHAENWSNRMILGDSLLVMNSLAEKEGLRGQVQMIYLDPPYGIRFASNWQTSTRKRQVEDGKVAELSREPEQIKAFRDAWRNGIHSYLAYLRDRFTVARDLLTDSGSIFVQIGDENVHLVRSLLDEIFGAANFVCLITVRKTGGSLIPSFSVGHKRIGRSWTRFRKESSERHR